MRLYACNYLENANRFMSLYACNYKNTACFYVTVTVTKPDILYETNFEMYMGCVLRLVPVSIKANMKDALKHTQFFSFEYTKSKLLPRG